MPVNRYGLNIGDSDQIEPEVISAINIDIDVRNLVILDDTTLSSSASSYSMSGIDSDYTRLQVAVYAINTTSSRDLLLNLNNSTGKMDFQKLTFSSGGGAVASAGSNEDSAKIGRFGTTGDSMTICDIYRLGDDDLNLFLSRSVWSGDYGYITTGRYQTAEAIDRIDLLTGGDQFDSGSRFIVRGLKW